MRNRKREREVTIYIVAISEGSNSSEDINDDAENSDKRGNEAETPAYNEERIGKKNPKQKKNCIIFF